MHVILAMILWSLMLINAHATNEMDLHVKLVTKHLFQPSGATGRRRLPPEPKKFGQGRIAPMQFAPKTHRSVEPWAVGMVSHEKDTPEKAFKVAVFDVDHTLLEFTADRTIFMDDDVVRVCNDDDVVKAVDNGAKMDDSWFTGITLAVAKALGVHEHEHLTVIADTTARLRKSGARLHKFLKELKDRGVMIWALSRNSATDTKPRGGVVTEGRRSHTKDVLKCAGLTEYFSLPGSKDMERVINTHYADTEVTSIPGVKLPEADHAHGGVKRVIIEHFILPATQQLNGEDGEEFEKYDLNQVLFVDDDHENFGLVPTKIADKEAIPWMYKLPHNGFGLDETDMTALLKVVNSATRETGPHSA